MCRIAAASLLRMPPVSSPEHTHPVAKLLFFCSTQLTKTGSHNDNITLQNKGFRESFRHQNAANPTHTKICNHIQVNSGLYCVKKGKSPGSQGVCQEQHPVKNYFFCVFCLTYKTGQRGINAVDLQQRNIITVQTKKGKTQDFPAFFDRFYTNLCLWLFFLLLSS